jgi:hypothetical protein
MESLVQGYITGQILPVDGGEWFGKKPMMPREMVSRASESLSTSKTLGLGQGCISIDIYSFHGVHNGS